ncbi:MAG: hypothetical protein ABL859_00880 [Methylotenera sp.]
MKKLISLAVVLGMVAGFVSPSLMAATTTSGPITVGATVATAVALNVTMLKNDFNGATVTSMDFGRLITLPLTGGGTTGLRSSATSTTGTGAVDVFISGNSQGAPYTISQTGTPVTSGANTLPAGALNVVPVYATQDNGGAALPAGASIGTPGTWVGTRTLYTSGSTGALRTIQAYYSVTDDPAAGATASVPTSQAAGTYTGTVTFTMTT